MPESVNQTRGGGAARFAPVVAVLAPLAVYLRTMAPDCHLGDSGELNTAAFSLGIAHVPGYPLYALVGKLFCLLPLGGVAFRLNLMSVVCAALALGLLYAVVARLTGRPLVALAAALAFAFTQTLWEESLKSRAYPLNLLFGAAILWAVLRWHEGDDRFLAPAAFLLGLGMANHEILLAAAPLVLAFVVAGRARLTWPNAAVSLLVFALGLSVYLYLPIRSAAGPLLDWGSPRTARALVDVLLQKQYGGKMLSPDLGPKIQMAGLIARSFPFEFAALPFALGLVGVLAMARRSRVLLAGLALLVLTNVLVRANYIGPYEFTQIYRYLINSYAAFAVAAGVGLAAAVGLVERHARPAVARGAGALLAVAVVASPLLAHARGNDLSNHWLAREYARTLLAFPEEGSLLFVGGDNDIYPIWNLQTIERFRQDVAAMGKAGFGGAWLRKEYGDRVDPAFLVPPPDLADYRGPDRVFHAFFENAVASGRFPVYAMYNDDDDPAERARWADLRERFDWWPRGLAIAFAAKGRDADLYRTGWRQVWWQFPWEAVLIGSVFDHRLARDVQTQEVLDVYRDLLLKHGLALMSGQDVADDVRFLRRRYIAKAGLFGAHELDVGDAERFFRWVLAIQADDFEARANLAVVLVRKGEFGEARSMLERLVGEPRADWRTWVNLAKVDAVQRDRSASDAALARAEAMAGAEPRFAVERENIRGFWREEQRIHAESQGNSLMDAHRLTPRERTMLAVLLVFLGVLWVYGWTLHFEFVYDDFAVAGQNAFIRDLHNLPKLFIADYYRLADENTYRPLNTLSYFLDYAVWGAEPFGFNFTSMLIHFLNGVLVLLLARRLLPGRLAGPLACALVFVLHPVATEAVISEGNREEALSVAFFAGALLLYLRARDGGPRARSWLEVAAATYAAGLFAMEVAITLPAVLVVLEVVLRDRRAPLDARGIGRRVAPFFAIAVLWLIGRFTVWVGTGEMTHFPGGSRYTAILTAARAYATYARLLVLPIHQHVVYDFPPLTTLVSAKAVGSLLFVLAVAAVGLIAVWRGRIEGLAALWFLGVLLPVSNAVVPFWIAISERYLYLIVPAYGLVAGALVQRVLALRGGSARSVLQVAAAAVVLAYGAAAAARAPVWQTSHALWWDNVLKAPHALDARYNLAIDYLRQGKVDEARTQFEIAARDHPEAAKPWILLATIHRKAGRPGPALEAIDRALALDPGSAEACVEKGYVFVEQRDFEKAAYWFARAAEIEPRDGGALSSLAGARLSAGRYDEAMAAARRALAVDPTDARALQVVAHVAALAGDREKAVALYAEVYRHADDPALEAAALANIRNLARGGRRG